MTATYICQRCGRSFAPKSRRRPGAPPTYCSAGCYHAAMISKIDKTCEYCGKAFQTHRGRPDKKYCSRGCYLKEHAAETVIKTCRECGREFPVSARRAGAIHCCSMACRRAATEYAKCRRCGKAFRVGRAGHQHCSEECRRPVHVATCETCGKEFRIVPTDAGRRFCSFACYRGFSGETSIERVVREALESRGIEFVQEYPIGRFSVDFFVPKNKVCIEADGGYWHSRGASKAREARRDAFLIQNGYSVYHLPEDEINRNVMACLSPALGD